MTTEERENKARRMLEAIDEDIHNTFCTGCEARRFTPATFEDPQEEWCPANFVPGDPGCIKEQQYQDLLEDQMELIEEMEESA